MSTAWGLLLIVLGAIAWGGQALSWMAPEPAARLGLTERESSVEPTFWADARGEAAWDTFTLWTLIVAGVLLIMGSSLWPSWGLIGGSTYLYFAGRGILTRAVMVRHDIRIGEPASIKTAFTFLAIWGLVAAVTVVASLVELT